MNPRTEFFDRCARALQGALQPFVADRRPYVILDYPDHANVGDSLIWLGQLAAIRAAGGREPGFVSTTENYDREAIARVIREDGVIFLHGGGNLGDLWPHHQQFREQVLQDFPAASIVQLPQSIEFQHDASLERARRAFAHPGLHLFVRTKRSRDLATEYFDCDVTLVPDAALALSPMARVGAPSMPAVFLARTDHEAGSRRKQALPEWIAEVDWLEETLSRRGRFTRALAARPRLWSRIVRVAAVDYEFLAAERAKRGMRMLSAGEVVITDRLHAHVLCILLDIPHFVLDNSYGKVQALYDTWTSEAHCGVMCASLDEAIERARAVLANSEATTS